MGPNSIYTGRSSMKQKILHTNELNSSASYNFLGIKMLYQKVMEKGINASEIEVFQIIFED